MIRKVLFLVGNRHFLIRKRHFGVFRGRYVGGVLQFRNADLILSSGVFPMIRNRILAATAIIAAVVLTACSDMTAPKNDAPCPVTNGSQICAGK